MYTKARTHNVYSEFRCVLCGESHAQAAAAIYLYDEAHLHLGDVCPECAESREQAAKRMLAHVQYLRERAEDLEALARKLPEVDPWATVEDLRAAEREANEEARKD